MRSVRLSFLSLLFLLTSLTFGQRSAHRINQRLDGLKASGASFQAVELFQAEQRSASNDALWSEACTNATVMHFDRDAARALLASRSELISLSLTTESGRMVLDLQRVDVLSDGFKITRASDGAIEEAPQAAHYRGVVRGEASSVAAISVFDGFVMGLVADAEGQRVLGPFEDGPQDLHVFYRERDLRSTLNSPCATGDRPVNPLPHGHGIDDAERTMRCVHVYWEAAFDIFQDKGSVVNVTSYLTGLFNQSATLFDNDGVDMLLNEVFVWDVASPYNATSSGGRLSQFATTRTSFNGELAHLLDYANYGGVAWLNVLCGGTSSRMAYSGINSSFSNVPTYSWSVMVVSHETGHNLGSPHTHNCSWNGNGTAIDGCGPTAGYTEGGCPNAGLPAGGGTVMSYCHLIGGTGINLNNGFGPQPAALIRTRVNAASCLLTCGTTCDAPGLLGTQSLTANSATLTWPNIGAASYDLRWKEVSSPTWNTVTGLVTNSYAISGLTQSVAYEFQVLSHCTGGASSAYSPSYTFTTPVPCPDSNEPNNTIATAAVITPPTSLSALIASASDVDYYTFTVALPSNVNIYMSGLPGDYDIRLLTTGGTQLAISQNGGTSSESINYSASAGTYVIHVYGYNGAFSSVTCYALNLYAYASCTIPSGLNATSITYNSATLGWTAIAGASGYQLQWKPSSGSVWTQVLGLATNSYALTGLAGNTSYDFQVRTVCAGQSTSEFSQTSSFTTTTPTCEEVSPILISARLFLEGPFRTSTQLMSDTLRQLGLIPLTEPYTAMGLAPTGALTTTLPVFAVTGNNAIVDWVLVELRDGNTPSTVIERKTGLLQRDGDVVAVNGTSALGFCSAPGAYRVAVRQRNHLGCMTNASVTLAGTTTSVDFTQSATVTYGAEARKTINAVMALWSGNTTGDASVRYTGANNDRDPILVRIGGVTPTNTVVGYYPEDVNMDGVSKYTGANNDRDPILVNIGGVTPTNVRAQQLP